MIRWVLALVVGVVASIAAADGKFFARTSDQLGAPDMPRQAAVIGHADGVQTLVIESVVDARGEPLAWIVPLPAAPTAIEEVGPGTVRTAVDVVAPSWHDVDAARGAALRAWFWAALALAVGAVLGRLALKDPTSTLGAALAASCAIVVVVVLLLPTLGTARGLGGSIDRSVVTTEVGRYDVHVLSDPSADACLEWLTKRGFAFDPADRAIVQERLDRGWVLCAAEVALERGERAPHPIRFVFPSDRIVYPFALTATTVAQQGAPIAVDLVVFADRPVVHPWMSIWCARARPTSGGTDRWKPFGAEWPAHPDLSGVADQAAWATRLHGVLDGRTHADDLVLEPSDPAAIGAPRRAKVTTPAGIASVVAVHAGWATVGLGLLAMPLAIVARRGGSRDRRTAGVAAVAITLSIAAAAAWAGREALRPLVVEEQLGARWTGPSMQSLMRLPSHVQMRIEQGADPAVLEAELRELLAWRDADGGSIGVEGLDVPFGWSIDAAGPDGPIVRIHDASGRLWRISRTDGIVPEPRPGG
jgi:hypothetical protein